MEICTNLGFFTKLLSIENGTINISLFAESKERRKHSKRIVICLELIMQSFEYVDFKEMEV